VTELVEADVAPDGESHEQDESGIEEDKSGLADVGVVEENETGSQNTGRERVARLPHDHEDGRDSQCTHGSGHCAVCNVGHLVCDVRVANVFKQEFAIVADQPACESEQELAKGRVHVEKVGSLEVVRCELAYVSDCPVKFYGSRLTLPK
jgi:hypothetical protein